MAQKQNDPMDHPAAAYDFSLESPAFRERLLAEFLKRAAGEWSVPLADEELFLLSAAGGSPSENSNGSSPVAVQTDNKGFAKRKKEEL